MAGDYILAVASMMIARLRSDDVTLVLSQVCTVLSFDFQIFGLSRYNECVAACDSRFALSPVAFQYTNRK